MKHVFFGLALALATALVPACSADDPAVEGDANVADVTVGSTAFSPKTVTIKVGQTVRWTWMGAGERNVVSGACNAPDDKFRSREPQVSGTYDHLFDVAGTFPYYSEVLCESDGMVGTVIVQ